MASADATSGNFESKACSIHESARQDMDEMDTTDGSGDEVALASSAPTSPAPVLSYSPQRAANWLDRVHRAGEVFSYGSSTYTNPGNTILSYGPNGCPIDHASKVPHTLVLADAVAEQGEDGGGEGMLSYGYGTHNGGPGTALPTWHDAVFSYSPDGSPGSPWTSSPSSSTSPMHRAVPPAMEQTSVPRRFEKKILTEPMKVYLDEISIENQGFRVLDPRIPAKKRPPFSNEYSTEATVHTLMTASPYTPMKKMVSSFLISEPNALVPVGSTGPR